MKICPNCHTSVIDTAKFCHKCRFNIKKYEEENTKSPVYCTECGAELLTDAAFCTECGADVITSDGATSVNNTESSINFDAFSSLSFAANEQLYAQNGLVVENGVLTGYTGKKRTVTVFGSIEEIYDSAFEGNQTVTCIEIEEGIKSIGRRAFASCPSLIEVSIPSSCKILYPDMFSDDSLKTLILPAYDSTIVENCLSQTGKKYLDEMFEEDYIEEKDGKVYVNIGFIEQNAKKIVEYEQKQALEEKRQAQLKKEQEERERKEEERKRNLSKYKIGSVHKIGFYPTRKDEMLWTVIDKTEDKALVICNNIIDCRKFNDSYKDTATWDNCSLRSWLNNEFIKNYFMMFESEKIITVYHQVTKNPTYKTSRGEGTYDKIFLLSIDEANTYFPNSDSTKCKVTPYARKNGAYADTSDYGYWWLRTTGELINETSYVFYSGGVSTKGYDATGTIFGVRPAMWIKMQ